MKVTFPSTDTLAMWFYLAWFPYAIGGLFVFAAISDEIGNPNIFFAHSITSIFTLISLFIMGMEAE